MIFVQIVPSVDGRDRWLIVRGNGIRWAWSAPRRLSWRSRRTEKALARRSPPGGTYGPPAALRVHSDVG